MISGIRSKRLMEHDTTFMAMVSFWFNVIQSDYILNAIIFREWTRHIWIIDERDLTWGTIPSVGRARDRITLIGRIKCHLIMGWEYEGNICESPKETNVFHWFICSFDRNIGLGSCSSAARVGSFLSSYVNHLVRISLNTSRPMVLD